MIDGEGEGQTTSEQEEIENEDGGEGEAEKQQNPLELSDEDFAKLDGPPPSPGSSEAVSEEDEGEAGDEDDGKEGEAAAEDDKSKDGKKPADKPAEGEEAGASEPEDKSKKDEKPDKAKPGKEAAKKAEPDPKAAKPAEGEEKPTAKDGGEAAYTPPSDEAAQAVYKQIMTPFKANGKTIELKTPEEVIQLMQMGANYTRKLQELQPQRKIVTMLANNGLLDEGKLSFLIDLDRKDPAAIKKLVKDAGIDPMEIDVEQDSDYQPGNHMVGDEEATFRTAIQDLASDAAGKETVVEINTNWDEASKEVLWKSPEIMSVIHEQRENGVYAQIKAEVDRQITLGKIPASVPFLQAYKQVGDEMVEAAKAAAPADESGSGDGDGKKPAPSAQPLTVRSAKPKPEVKNDAQAKAASTSRSNPATAKTAVNPLAMSDEDFLKQMEGRL